MARWREVIYDNLKSLKQVSATSDIQEYQVLFWAAMVGNKLMKQHLDKEFVRTGMMSGKYVTVFPEVEILSSPISTTGLVKSRKYIELPGVIMDSDFDKGVDYVTYALSDLESGMSPNYTRVLFSRTTGSGAFRVYSSHEEPSPKNPYFLIQGKIMYFLGLENTDIKKLEIGLYLTIDPRTVIDMEQECPIPEHLLEQLSYGLKNLGTFALSVPADKLNDGNDTVQTQAPKPQTQQADAS